VRRGDGYGEAAGDRLDEHEPERLGDEWEDEGVGRFSACGSCSCGRNYCISESRLARLATQVGGRLNVSIGSGDA
jgi:hypothetical protein